MNDNDKPRGDAAAEAELKGVPEEFLEGDDDCEAVGGADGALAEAIEQLRRDLEAAKQDVLYAKADTQNVRRRLEKDVAEGGVKCKGYVSDGSNYDDAQQT